MQYVRMLAEINQALSRKADAVVYVVTWHSGTAEGGASIMNGLLSGLCVAFSMYSLLPMPQLPWEKKTMRYALCFLPLVGVLVAACEYAWPHVLPVFSGKYNILRHRRSAVAHSHFRRYPFRRFKQMPVTQWVLTANRSDGSKS